MRRVDYRDVIGGTLVTLGGVGAMYHSLTSLQVGTLARMGPGYFPALVGGLLILCGLMILIPALLRAGPMPHIEFRPLFWISISTLAFALLLIPFGLIPAVIAQSLLSGMADRKLSWAKSLLLSGGLAILATLIFRVGLGMTVSAFSWPW